MALFLLKDGYDGCSCRHRDLVHCLRERTEVKQRMPRVLLVSDCSLFSRGLEDLLRLAEGVEFVGRVARGDGLVDSIEQIRPNVVLLECDGPGNCPADGLVGSLCDGAVGWAICVSLADNSVFILHGERRMLQDVDELVAAVTGSLPGYRLTERPCCAVEPARGGKEEDTATIST
jgi:hypothetical protein